MTSPDSTTRIAARTSIIESIRGFTLKGIRIDKEELKHKIIMPEYLRFAMRDAIKSKGAESGLDYANAANGNTGEAPEGPLVVFINSRSGGRHGPELKVRLQELMSEEQVFDLSDVRPHEFVQYGLSCLEKFAGLGDRCAKETREKLRVVVAGGDGTVGWVLGCLGDLNKQGRMPVPPVAVIPLGTGNDLSRSFGWGGSFPFNWKSGVKRTLDKATKGPVCRLDRKTIQEIVGVVRKEKLKLGENVGRGSHFEVACAQGGERWHFILDSLDRYIPSWDIVISMPAGEKVNTPYALKPTEDCTLDQGLEVEGELPEKVTCHEGVFYNYFSIGMDAQVAYGFHHLRNEKPYLAQGPITNKLIYSGYTCTQGWFFTPCIANPNLRGLKNILRIHIKRANCSDWESIPVPSSVRAIVALNLHSYASGRNPWGNLKPKYMEKKGFVEAHADDGLLEIFGLKQGWHASFVMVELISAKHIAQASSIRFEFRGGEWKEAFMQMDGEPWKQPMNKEYSTFVEIKRVPFQSVMVSGE